jgi:hypothetical protein
MIGLLLLCPFSLRIPLDDSLAVAADEALRDEVAWLEGMATRAVSVQDDDPLTLAVEYEDEDGRWVVDASHPHRTSDSTWIVQGAGSLPSTRASRDEEPVRQESPPPPPPDAQREAGRHTPRRGRGRSPPPSAS